jgi:hypothetical protein
MGAALCMVVRDLPGLAARITRVAGRAATRYVSAC